jgi:hypothetical protein
MKKILFSVMAAMVSMASMAALSNPLAAFDGTYVTNTATIAYYTPQVGSQNNSTLSIGVEADGANKVNLSIKDFSFNGMNIGDIEAALTADADGEGGYVLSTPTKVEGPYITALDYETELEVVSVASGLYNEGGKKIDLQLNVYIKGSSSKIADVTFSGAEFTPATSVKENKVLSVYPTVATSVVNVPENGEFTIYSLAGSSVKSGVVSNGSVSVADLAAGNYVISVNGKNARFIKK